MSVFGDYISGKLINDELAQSTEIKTINNDDLIIAVFDRGWVFVGFATHLEEERIRLDCCHNIHSWGTTKGLGELAIKGPLADTVLNPCAPVVGKPIFVIKVDDERW